MFVLKKLSLALSTLYIERFSKNLSVFRKKFEKIFLPLF